MSKYLRTRKGQMSNVLIAVAAVGIVWQGTELVKQSMADLPIRALPKVTSKISVADVKSLPWVWEKSPAVLKHERLQAEANAAGRADVNVEEVFGQKEEKPPEPVRPKFEFDKFFKQNARVDAVASNGAVINGRFFELGSDMEMLAMVGDHGNKVVPLLRSVTDTGVLVRIGKQDVRLALQGKGAQ